MVIVQLDKTRPRTAVTLTTRRKRTNLMRGQKRGTNIGLKSEWLSLSSKELRIDNSEQILVAHN